MVGFREAYRQGVKSSLCQWFNLADENVRGWYGAIYGRELTNPILSGLRAMTCDLPPLPPSAAPPFEGGQCDQLYEVVVINDYGFAPCSNPSNETAIFNEQAPVSGVPGPFTWLGEYDVAFNSCGDGSKSKSKIGIQSADGRIWDGGSNDRAAFGQFVTYNRSTFRLTPEGGQPDDCGDPPLPETPPDTPDGGWSLPPVNITYDNSTGGTTNVNISPTIYAPVVNLDGSVYAPVRITGPDIALDANVEIGVEGGIDIEFSGPTFEGGDTFVDGPVTVQPPGLEPPPTDDDDTERRIIGVLVTVTNLDGTVSTEILQTGGNPNLYVPDLGVVSFSISAGGQGYGWTTDLRVKNTRAYIPCPAPQGAVSVKGTPRPGVAWSLDPVYGARDRAYTSPI